MPLGNKSNEYDDMVCCCPPTMTKAIGYVLYRFDKLLNLSHSQTGCNRLFFKHFADGCGKPDIKNGPAAVVENRAV